MIAVTVTVDWGREIIRAILPELKKYGQIAFQEPGCDDFSFAIAPTPHLQRQGFLRQR
jgi:hypothetical protein